MKIAKLAVWTVVALMLAMRVGAKEEKSFRETFDVDKANLGPTGDNKYFPLKPGRALRYKDEDGTLLITVLDDTQVIDGVTTRVVEEREEKNGKLIEVSRNFFAADKTDGAVYYFGEDVDIYKDGKVVNHESAWRSGENGAKFGLFVPANPKVGDRFYQEQAPKVAMDRAEVVSIDETVNVQAGRFQHCVRMKETSPLEKGSSVKVYAPNVGLVQDDEMELVKIEPK
ncbi:MAG TPA: hypothetical protein VF669_17085 [Tepidisphaeraceae bacterium]|jgi:hypothetical protein